MCTIYFVLLLSCGNKHKICCYVDIIDKDDKASPGKANEKCEASHSEEAIKPAGKKSKLITGKGKPSKMQVAFEKNQWHFLQMQLQGGHSLFNNHIIMFTMILTVNKHFPNFIVNKY